MPSSFEFRGLRCFESSTEPGAWCFLPKRPRVQLDAAMRPMVSMVDLGASAYLLFTASWDASPRELDALRQEIAARTGEPDAGRIRLAFAPIGAPRCNALVGDGSGTFRILASNATSGFPPYDAVFNLQLQDERLAQARAGLRGEPGFLGIEYVAALRNRVKGRATLDTPTGDLLPWLRSRGANPANMRALVEKAVEAGVAAVVIDVPAPHESELAPALYERVLSRAAELLPRWVAQGGPADVEVAVVLEQELSDPIRAFADVATLVAAPPLEYLIGGQDAAD